MEEFGTAVASHVFYDLLDCLKWSLCSCGMTVGWIEDFGLKMVKIVKPSDMLDCKPTELVDFDGEW